MTALSPSTHPIDPYLFEKHLDAFLKFVERKSGMHFESFASNPYIRQEEGYKLKVSMVGNEALNFGTWETSSVGTGQILKAVIHAIEIPGNNLVPWEARYGEERRPHQPFYVALGDAEARSKAEACLFRLYRGRDTGKAFEDLVEVVGRKYPLLAYLMFLKDNSRFLPIAPMTFEHSFRLLGIDFSASGKCSWVNYQHFNGILLELKDLLSEQLDCEVSVLDTHSFAWIIGRQMEEEGALPDVRDYQELGPTEREAVVKARIGQGRFRDALIEHWGSCAVTGVTDPALLRASHIIPWSEASIQDRTNLFNGLLLAVHMDALFEVGLISFDDNGEILISPALSGSDAAALGVHKGMSLRSVDDRHLVPLKYHRSQRFLTGKPEPQSGESE